MGAVDRTRSESLTGLLLAATLVVGAAATSTAFARSSEPGDGGAPSEAALRSGIDESGDDGGGGDGSGGGRVLGPAIVPATVITQDGQTPAGLNGAITSLNAPFTNGLGQPGFTGGASDGVGGTDNFVWFSNGVVFRDSTVVAPVLSGGESTMGIGNAGEFIYSPSADGDDSVWTHNGLLLTEGPAPGFPAGTNNTFNSRPQMDPSGRAYWVAGFNDAGGTTSLGRVLYTSSDSTPGSIAVVLRSDDLVGGFPVDRPSGIDFDYQFSDNGGHQILALTLDTGSTANDLVIAVDGTIVAQEGSPTGGGDNWSGLDNVSINDSGHYLFSGDTSGATATDEFIAYDGVIAVREGDVIDGQPITSSASVQAVSINNLGQAVYHWSISGGTELLFYACDASDLAGTSHLVLATGDQVDLDGNGTGDATVTDFNGSSVVGPSLSLAEFGTLFIEVDLDYGGGDLESVIELDLPLCGAPATITVAPPSLESVQPADSINVLPLTVGNIGSVNLAFTITEAPADCGAPSDLPWASAAPGGGVLAPSTDTTVDVTFDSTGIASGTLTGLLCIASNDPANPVVSVPLTLTVGTQPSILEIPTLSLEGLAALVLLLAALSIGVLRRRRTG